ncbi:LacI family DNA-binding transcriptional regulator [Streptacidiphilus sp. MAP5-3]|uniref:LacI family DNA-binding transcriptional regulator n=1 Tax=unclassified Streptacidiphilus TaxID=2643834 RepID=UPI003511E3A9
MTQAPGRRPTMRDVAREAGVSPMTVSRVLSGEPGVSAEKAASVERAVRRLGYRRNDLARMLRRKGAGSRTIGLVVDDLANPFYALMARSVEDAAYRQGYVVLVGSTNDDRRREREVIAAFCSRQVDGLILVPTCGSHGFLRPWTETGTRVVCLDRPARGLDVDTVTVDNRAGARGAVEHLLDHGHRRIAYLGDRLDIWTQRERHLGYREALAARGVAAVPELLCHGLRSRTEAASAVAAMLAADGPPTALFATNGLISAGALDAVRAGAGAGAGAGGSAGDGAPGAGDDPAIVGFDDLPFADRLDQPLTVVNQDPAAIGGTGAALLFARIEGDRSAPRSVVLLTRLIPRGSGERPPLA